MSDAELRQKVAKEWAKKTGSEYCCRDGFEEGWDAARANLDPRVERLIEAVRRTRDSLNFPITNIQTLMHRDLTEALAEWEKGE